MTNIEFEENSQLMLIERHAFESCSNLKVITIPASVTSIGDGVFMSCTNLTDVYFEPNSELKNIGENAFSSCNSLETIKIPSGVEIIKSYTFSWCTSLTSIVIPKSVTTIDYYAFNNCTKLKTLFFEGTIAEKSISIGSNNEPLNSANWYYYTENAEETLNGAESYWHYVDGIPTPWTTD